MRFLTKGFVVLGVMLLCMRNASAQDALWQGMINQYQQLFQQGHSQLWPRDRRGNDRTRNLYRRCGYHAERTRGLDVFRHAFQCRSRVADRPRLPHCLARTGWNYRRKRSRSGDRLQPRRRSKLKSRQSRQHVPVPGRSHGPLENTTACRFCFGMNATG